MSSYLRLGLALRKEGEIRAIDDSTPSESKLAGSALGGCCSKLGKFSRMQSRRSSSYWEDRRWRVAASEGMPFGLILFRVFC